LTSITLDTYTAAIHTNLFNSSDIPGSTSLQAAWVDGSAGTYTRSGTIWTKLP
jgi:hypothetical protein